MPYIKRWFRSVLLGLGTLLLFNTIRMVIMDNSFNNILFSLGLTLAVLAYGFFFDRLKKVKWLNAVILSGAVFVCALILFFTVYGWRDNADYSEDAVLVLGAGLRGESVSLMLKTRLDAAAEYYFENPDALIVVSGGQGSNELITEALAMERYLLSKNIPAASIVREEQSNSTYQNMFYSKTILDGLFPNGYSVVVITNDFHIYRAERLARIVEIANGQITHLHANTPFYAVPVNDLRECAAIIKLWLLKR